MRPGTIGLIPAAGRAARLGRLPCSKEVLPISYSSRTDRKRVTTSASELLIESFAEAGVRETLVVIREGKWDIPDYLGDGRRFRMNLAYVVAPASPSVPLTLDAAYPFLADSEVVFGFPDILFDAESAFSQLLSRRSETAADLVLGLFPAEQPERVDMVSLGQRSRVEAIVIKPKETELKLAWILAVWGPSFSDYLHDWVGTQLPMDLAPDVHLGEVMNSALSDGFVFESVTFEGSRYIDIGTPEDLAQAVKWRS